MIPLVSVEYFLSRVPPAAVLPAGENGEADEGLVGIGLTDATGIIVTHLPWLLDTDTGEIAQPINPQFADALSGICFDIALYRLTDSVQGSEDSRNKYLDNMALLKKINQEYQGGLEGPGIQAASIVLPNKTEGIPDCRYFKKGRMY
jgi:phage gp36-like protein